MQILILGDYDDDQVLALVPHLQDCQIEFFNSETCHQYTFSYDLSFDTYTVEIDGEPFIPDAIYWRSINDEDFDDEDDEGSNWEGYLEIFYNAFPFATWINGPTTFVEHSTKMKQLKSVEDLVTIPDTLYTNDFLTASLFLQEYKTLAVKPICGGRHTKKVSKKGKLEKLIAQSCQPLCLQQFIEGTCVRSYVIGDKVFNAEFHTDKADFRADKNCEPTRLIAPALDALAVKVTKDLGYHWTAIDWIRQEDGEYVFLEANFSPMFANFEQMTGYPIAKILAQYILDII